MSRKRRRNKRRTDDTATAIAVEREDEAKSDASSDPPEAAAESGLEAVDSEPLEPPESDAAARGQDPEGAAGQNEDELEHLAAEAREMRSLAQRKQAEFENYRRRIERERAETVKYAAAEVVKEIIPVLDNLERAVEAAKTSASEGDGQLRAGVEIVCKQFRDILIKLGLREVDAEDAPFDPHVHEAVGRVETDEHPEGMVVEVFQKGYLFKDRLLRPSMVSVSLPIGGESSPEDQESEDEAVRQEE